jgi:hypothetical protein
MVYTEKGDGEMIIVFIACIVFGLFCTHMAAFTFGKSRAYRHACDLFKARCRQELEDEITVDPPPESELKMTVVERYDDDIAVDPLRKKN